MFMRRQYLFPLGTVSLITVTVILAVYLALPASSSRGDAEHPVSMGRADDILPRAEKGKAVAMRHPTEASDAEGTARRSHNQRLLPDMCGIPVGYCCDCDGNCENTDRWTCLNSARVWRVADTCETHACNPGAPINDLCASVVAPGFPFTSEGIALYDNSCALSDGINPVSSEESPGANDINVAGDLWYKYIATCDGLLTISTCATGTDGLDTIVMAYKDPTDPTACICPIQAEHDDVYSLN